jgi:hypothetical protein
MDENYTVWGIYIPCAVSKIGGNNFIPKEN